MSPTPVTPGEELTPVKRALLEIRELRARLAEAESSSREPIAIVGAGLRLPGGVRDLETLWTLLAEGRDAITEIPRDRWDVEALYDADADAPGRMVTRHGGFVDAVDRFDAEFFGISPREAESMDPQQRLTLEIAWHALEDAGIAPAALDGTSTGVFLGVANGDYARMVFAHRDRIDPYFSIGNAGSVLAGRLSYFLGLHGPAITIDTACSSSLVALHLAMQSLRSGESDVALAGGVNLILSPEININFSKARMMAVDGRCKTFDAAADGYVRGEGCGVVVLKRLRDCTPADRIRAILRGSALNQDGRSSGLTAPNGPAQEAVVRAALENASITPADVGYVEAHGTGTPLGDPIEVQALGEVLGPGRDPAHPLALGSIKTNIGHLEAAAGIAGLLKLVVALEHRVIPPHLHLTERNRDIDWTRYPISIPVARTPWQPIGGRRIAGLSSFGFSGTNAHVIVEEAPGRQASRSSVERPQHVIALSARDPRALAELASDCAKALEGGQPPQTKLPLADAAFTANTGRSHFAHRLSVRAASARDAADALAAAAEGREAAGLVRGTASARPRIAFLFTGGGAQSPGMARSLYERAPVFREALDAAAAILDPMLDRPLLEVLNAPGDLEAPIHHTRYGQPALVAVEIALAALWRSWGIVPSAVLGHSLGEYAAAHVAGVLSLEDALRIVVERTRAVDALQGRGGMATIFASAEEVQEHLAASRSAASIAAYNSPEQVAVSGPADAVEAVAAHYEKLGTRVSRLRVAYASHSSMMESALAPFERAIAGIVSHAPRIAFVSNLTGARAGLDTIGRAAYWRDHLRQPVRFAQSMEALADLGITHYLEIGPHPVLVGMGAACVGADASAFLPSLRRNEDDWSVILDSLQQLYAAGAEIDWRGFDAGYARRIVSLPVYPFQRKRHWADWARAGAATQDPDGAWEAVGAALALQSGRGPIGVDLSNYGAKWASLERVLVAHAVEVLREAKLFAREGERHDAESVRKRLGASEAYRHLLHRWLERLCAAGLLRAEADAFAAAKALPEPGLAAAWAEAERLLADNRELLAYVRHCAALLGPVIRGEQSPLETLFPGGDYALADDLYRRSATMRYMNDLAASAVAAFAGARPSGTLRALEVGAGTGGTTAALLPQLPAKRTRYRYTDVSPFFFERARTSFSAHPFLELSELDIDRDPASQGVAPGSVDLVIASNAVHASRDLRAALKRLREMIAPGGMLLLVESTTHHAWFDMTTGLIEGWQHFADDLRTDNPLLPAATWVRALREAGFDDAIASPGEGVEAAAVGQHVIVARVGGIARASDEVSGVAQDAVPSAGVAADPAAEARALRGRILESLPADRLELLRDFVRARVVRILRLDPNDPPPRNARLMDLGFDSLMAVQLRNQLRSGLALEKQLPATLLFDHPTIDAIATFLLSRIGAAESATAAAPAQRAGTLGAAAVAAMSDAEIEAALMERLGKP
jgi:acyl transferase domain-containing protein